MRYGWRRLAALNGLLAAAVVASACRAESPGAGPPAGLREESLSGPAYLQELVLKRIASRQDLVQVLARLLDRRAGPEGASRASVQAHLTDRMRMLRDAGILPGGLAEDLSRPLERGHASLCVSRYLDLGGGLSGFLSGGGPRTAYRELVYLGLMPRGGEHKKMTGAELVALLAKVRQLERLRREDS